MKKIKLFWENEQEELEVAVNEFLDEIHPAEIIEISYHHTMIGDAESSNGLTFYETCMIFYDTYR